MATKNRDSQTRRIARAGAAAGPPASWPAGQRSAQKRRHQLLGFLNIKLMGTLVLVILGASFLTYAVMEATKDPDLGPTPWQKAQADSSALIPGTYVPPHPGADGTLCEVATCVPSMDDRLHVPDVIPICPAEQLAAKNYSEPLCYNSNPPTSGPHSASPMPFKVLENPAPKESLVHNMEHGAVVVWYNTDDQRVIDQLKSIVNAEMDKRRLLVMSKYTEMEPNTIALTSWTRLLKFDAGSFDKKQIVDFIEENSRRFNPEGL